MALIEHNARLVAEVAAKYDLRGAFCTLGRLYPPRDLSFDTVADILRDVGRPVSGVEALPGFAGDGTAVIPDENVLLIPLGFEIAESLDYLPNENPTYLCDLNGPNLPDEIYGRFDMVYNNGTLEHVFHVPNVLANMTKMLKVGGLATHVLPMNNHVGHGFYQFSPNLMFDYYHKNAFEILDSWIIRYADKKTATPRVKWRGDWFNPYENENLEAQMDAAVYAHIFVARKTADSTTDRIPQQGEYAGRMYAARMPSTMQLMRHVQRLTVALEQAQVLLDQKS